MIRYIEAGDVTIKEEYTAIGWSVMDAELIYKVKITTFSIADGFIAVNNRLETKDGKPYECRAYRNFNNVITEV